MKLGISLGPKPEEVSRVPEEFDFVEISIGEMEIAPEEIDTGQLKQDLEDRDLDLVVHLPFRQPIVTSVEEFNQAQKDYLERLLEFSSELGAEKAVVHANLRYGEDKEEMRERLEEQLGEISELGQEHGVEVCFENIHFETSKAADIWELADILEDLGLSMCFDNGHAFAEIDQEEIAEFLEEYTHIISHLHIQDTREGKDLHMPIGSAEFDFSIIGDTLPGFAGTACLEIFTSDSDYLKLSREKFREHF